MIIIIKLNKQATCMFELRKYVLLGFLIDFRYLIDSWMSETLRKS